MTVETKRENVATAVRRISQAGLGGRGEEIEDIPA
jgi:hypothetical protein